MIGELVAKDGRGSWMLSTGKSDVLYIIDNAPCGIVVHKSVLGKILYINRAALDTLGYTLSEVPTKRVAEAMLVPDKKLRKQMIDSWKEMVKAGGGTAVLEFVAKGGAVKYCEWNTVVLRHNMIVSMYTDVTKRVQAERELREREVRFHLYFEKSPDPVVLFEGDRVVDCNPAALSVFRCEAKEQIVSLTFEGLSAKKQPDGITSSELVDEIFRVARGKISHRFEWMMKCLDGHVFPAEATIGVIQFAEKQILYIVFRDITGWKEAEKALLQARDELEIRVRERTASLEALNQELLKEIKIRSEIEEELKSSREELRHLSEHLHRAREEERTRIAREVHDELGQFLTALKMDLTFHGQSLSIKNGRPLEQIRDMGEQIDVAIKTVRQICTELRPPILEDFGLLAAVEWYIKEFQKRTGLRCIEVLDSSVTSVKEELALVIFRILQEAMTNVWRHARASVVEVNLGKDLNNLVLKVKDNGRGISKKQLSSPRSFGIIGIRERVRFWGGQSTFDGARSHGTTMTVSIPFSSAELRTGI